MQDPVRNGMRQVCAFSRADTPILKLLIFLE